MDANAGSQQPGKSSFFRSTDFILAVSIFGIAFLLRLIYVLEISVSPFFENLVIDCARYSDWGSQIAAGDWVGERIFYQSPLYAYFLGVIYRFLTTSLFAVRLIQAAIGSASCVLVFLITRRLFDRRAALLAGVSGAAFAPFIYYDAMIMKTVLSIFLGALGLYLLLRARDSRRPGLWFACGLAWAAAGLVRENYLLIAAAFAAWHLIRHLRDRHNVKLKGLWFYLAGLVVVILPVAIRNAAAGGEFALVTSQAGQNFFIGNHGGNRTGAYEPPEFVTANPYYEEKSFREFAEKSTGREMSAGEVSAFYRNRALGWMWDNPGAAAALQGKKFLLFFNDYEVADNQSIYFMERYSQLLRMNFVRFGFIAPFGLLGLALLWRRRKQFAPLYIFGIVYAASVIAFFVFGRYRLPVMLVLLPADAYATFWIIDKVRQHDWKALLKPAVALVGLFIFVCLPVYRYHDEVMAMRFINLGQVHVRLGLKLQDESRPERALARFGEALDAYAQARKLLPLAAEPHFYAGRVLMLTGNLREAERQYRRAVLKGPRFVAARVELARLLFDQRVGAIFEAHEELAAVLQIEPDNAEAKELHGRVMAALRDQEAYEAILADSPNGNTWAFTYLGVALLLNGDEEKAFGAIEKALKLNQDYIPANNAMALLFVLINKHDAAAYYAKRVLKLGSTVWHTIRRELESRGYDLYRDDSGRR